MGLKYILKLNSTWGSYKKWLITMISLGLEFNSMTKRIKDDSKEKDQCSALKRKGFLANKVDRYP